MSAKMPYNKPLKFVTATRKSVAFTRTRFARLLAGRHISKESRMKSSKTYCLVSVFALSACGGGGGGNVNENNVDIGLDGYWVSNCYLDDFDEYTIDEFTFNGNSFETSYRSYDNASCTGVPIEGGDGDGTFTVGSLVNTDSGVEAYQVDFVVNYLGETFEVEDLIRVEDDIFYYGDYSTSDGRPSDLDFDVVLRKQ